MTTLRNPEAGNSDLQAGAARQNWFRALGWPFWLLVFAAAGWLIGLRAVGPGQMGGLGLIAQLSPLTLIAYPLAVASGVGELRRPDRRGWLLSLITVVLVVMVYGLQPAVEGVARLPVAWLHAGFTEYIAQTGSVLTSYDTRFSWPGFFAAAAFISKAAGFSEPTALLAWAPLFFAGIGVLAFRALAFAVFKDRRAGWIATWIFALTNWTEQDYFSPQGTAFILFVGALAITVRYLVRPDVISGGRVRLSDRPVPETSPRNRIWAQLVVIGLATAMAPTHQLTPYVLVGMLLLLLLFGRLQSGWLPFLAFVPVATWFVLGGKDFWASQLNRITGSIGRVDSSFSQGIGQRLAGDTGHQIIVASRIGITVLVGALACVGLLILRRRGMRTWVLPALAASAFALALVQPYGGEVFVRSYLFALPWFAIGAASAITVLVSDRAVVGTGSRPPAAPVGLSPAVIGRSALLVVVLSVLGLTTVAARGGNDAYVTTTPADLAAMQYVYDTAAAGDSVVALLWFSPLRSSRVGDLRQVVTSALVSSTNACDSPETLAACVDDAKVDFVIVNPQQDAAGQILDGFPAGWTTGVVGDLVQGRYRIAFAQDNSLVLARTAKTG